MSAVPPNSAPTLSDLSAFAVFDEEAVNLTPQLLDADVTFSDAENNFDGGSLALGGLQAWEQVGIRHQGTGVGQIGLDGANVTYGGIVIGTWQGGALGAGLSVTFNAAANSAAIEALIENLTYMSLDDQATSGSLLLSITDAAGATVTAPEVLMSAGSGPFAGTSMGSEYQLNPTFADLDGDGDLDLVAGNYYGEVRYYQNTGTNLAPAFIDQTGLDNPFASITGGRYAAPTLGDLDGDGDLDAVVGETNGMLRYFLNDGTAFVPTFTEQTLLDNPFDGIDVGWSSAPELADLDGDGDLDLVVGDNYGTLSFFRNTGTNLAPAFEQQLNAANPFDGIDVGTYSTPRAADVDGDGDLDLVVGSYSGNLNYLENTGNVNAPAFVLRTGGANPFGGISVGTYSAPALADLDGDGHLELLVGEYDQQTNFFAVGSRETMAMVPQEGSANPFNGVDVGDYSTPTLVNFDGDSDLDLVVGEKNGTLRYFQNTGAGYVEQSGANPFADVALGASSYAAPTFADVDGDGDLDLVVGEYNTGTLHYFRNDAGAFVDQTGETDPAINPFTAVDTGRWGSPSFGDLDGDGDLDLIAGNYYGSLRYYENTGSVGAPVYTPVSGPSDPFSNLSLNSYDRAVLVDLDNDGDLDLAVGTGNGQVEFHVNTGTASSAVFSGTPVRSLDIGESYAAASHGDMDGDGDLDMVVGGYYGTVRYFESSPVLSLGVSITPHWDGSSGDDVMHGYFTSNSPINGYAGNDTIFIHGYGTAYGNDGNDSLSGGDYGYAELIGGAGNDTLDGGSNVPDGSNVTAWYAPYPWNGINAPGDPSGITATLIDGSGTVLDGFGDTDTLININRIDGSNFADTVSFSGSRAMSAGLADGNDVFNGGDGASGVSGGTGDDTLNGGAGNDALNGEAGNDNLSGGGGNDMLSGGVGDDTLAGGTGSDTASYFSYYSPSAAGISVTLVGGAATVQDMIDTDSVTGGIQSGTDILIGIENLVGTNFADTLIGDGADNIFEPGMSGTYGSEADSIDGGAGFDIVSFINRDGNLNNVYRVVVQLTEGSQYAETMGYSASNNYTSLTGIGYAFLTGIEGAVGTWGNDYFTGSAGDNMFEGLGGNDTIIGGGGIDTVTYASNPADPWYSGVTVNLVVGIGTASDGTGGTDSLWDITNAIGSGLGDTLNGSTAANVLSGLAGNDSLNGGLGADWLQGGAGNDTLILTPDGVWSSANVGFNEGSPTTAGTSQKVSLVGMNRFSDVVDGGSEVDTLQLTGGNDAYFLHDAFSGFTTGVALGNDVRGQSSAARGLGIEQILAGGGNDLIDLTSANYSIAGVTIDGGAGNDTMWGNAGNDTLLGGDGNDILFGGAGNDFLTGGAGADVFQFVQSGGGADWISDFNIAQDKLALFGATSLSQLTSHVSGGDLVVDWNGQSITLQGVTAAPSAGWIVFS